MGLAAWFGDGLGDAERDYGGDEDCCRFVEVHYCLAAGEEGHGWWVVDGKEVQKEVWWSSFISGLALLEIVICYARKLWSSLEFAKQERLWHR